MLPSHPQRASGPRFGSLLLVLILAASPRGTWALVVDEAGQSGGQPRHEASDARQREVRSPQTAHREEPSEQPGRPRHPSEAARPRLKPGERLSIDGIDGGVVVGLSDNGSPRRIRTGPERITGELVIYSNTSGFAAFPPGADVLIADDLTATAIGTCGLTAYEIEVTGGGDGTGSGFEVETALYDACPGTGGQIVSGTQHVFVTPDDGPFLLRRDLNPAVEIGPSPWLGVRFSTSQAAWVVGAPPEIGFSQNLYDHPSVPCSAGFGPALHASFYARLVATADCSQFEFVQVNVDANGLNVLGDAANEPSIAVDPINPNRIAIGWRQFDTVASNFRQAGRGYSTDGGQSWTFPGVLDPGVFRSDPVLDFDAEGSFYFNSLRGDFTTGVFRSINGGMTWSPPTFAYGGDKQWMAVDRTGGIGRGNIYQTWSLFAGCCGNATFNRSTDGGATFETPMPVPFSPFWGTMSVGPDGELYIVGAGDASTLALARSSNARNPAATPVFELAGLVPIGGALSAFSGGPNPGGLVGQAWVATDHSAGPSRGNVYLLASVDPPEQDPLNVMFTRSEDGGMTWSVPMRVNDDPPGGNAWQWFGTMSVAPNGRIDVIWNDTRRSGNDRLSELYYSFSVDQGNTWSANKQLSPIFDSHIGWPDQNKIGDYYDMISHDNAAYLAFSATFNGEQDVYFLKITVDCNGNGIPDPTDIADGTSADCDGNSVPDECEPNLDCNGNGVQDICDVAGATSEDCNANRVPDECESAADCNGNQIADICDLASGSSGDCNDNARPDECDVADGTASDCNANLVPDVCDLAGLSADCNGNGLPDECDISDCNGDPACADCNANGIPDGCDVGDLCGPPIGPCPGEGNCCDAGGNSTPGCSCASCCAAVCALDTFCCNTQWDALCASLAAGQVACNCDGAINPDCNANGVPDECESSADCNTNGLQDICEVAQGVAPDCNANTIPDECDVRDGTSRDCAFSGSDCCFEHDAPGCSNSAVEACVCAAAPNCCTGHWDAGCLQVIELFSCADCGTLLGPNQVPDECDIADGLVADCNNSGVPDPCEIAGDFTADGRVGLGDYHLFPPCMTGVEPVSLAPGCCYFDGTRDSDLDLFDYAAFQNQFNGD